MILAIHIAAINGHPFSLHAIGAEGEEIVCQIGPALIRPEDWLVPDGSPRTHRQCVKWGLPFRAVMGAVLRMAENASIFVAADMEVVDFSIRGWCITDKALSQVMASWTRPGPERCDVLKLAASDAPPKDAIEVWNMYRAAVDSGIAA